MNTTPAKLDTTFGPAWSKPPLFYNYEAALRFELAMGSHPIDRFLSAHRRAGAVAQHTIGDAEDLTLAVQAFIDPDKTISSNLLRLFRALRDCGLPTPDRQSIRVTQPDEDDDQPPSSLQMTIPFDTQLIPRVLWAAIAGDLGIRPNIPASLYIVSIKRGMLLHPYDDRGMDIIATSIEAIRSTYRQFKDWLLQHGMDKMKKSFGD